MEEGAGNRARMRVTDFPQLKSREGSLIRRPAYVKKWKNLTVYAGTSRLGSAVRGAKVSIIGTSMTLTTAVTAALFVVGLLLRAPRQRPSIAILFPAALAALCAISFLRAVAEPAADSAGTSDLEAEPPLILPEGWPEGHPVPIEKTNCVRCHLGAGRELTRAVFDFVHSVHDLNGMSCHDCHGGDTEDDALAHDEEAGFIGTKLSAHLENCASCHSDAAELLAAGPHHWDFSERINVDYPMCIECHGNHDVGHPPPDLPLKQLCEDCHDNLDDDYPTFAGIVAEHDKLWAARAEIHKLRLSEEHPLPEEFEDEAAEVRYAMMEAIHLLGDISDEEAEELKDRTQRLRRKFAEWLRSAAADSHDDEAQASSN